ncbi:MAG: 2-oxoacid:acceptor oxidoreductase subunit alpha [Deltaproteobacteria bacterium]|nr:2-oxoacid:acceptor oxidoreductase subunit alpha [Deltaproteobacteria bacterium]
MVESCNILIGGEAGQGLVTLGQLLARSLVRSGYRIVVTQAYQSRVRGGHNTFAVRVGPGRVRAPALPVDLLIAMNEEAVRLHGKRLTVKGVTIVDESVELICDSCIRVPFRELAEPRFFNIALLGVAGCLLGLDRELICGLLGELFAKKKPEEIKERNRQVLDLAYRWAEGEGMNHLELPAVAGIHNRWMLNGNEAIAYGAVSAGLRFCAYYPMTPATSIPMTLIATATETGIVVEQAEDEIAAVNMAIGASFAGVPSMTATSGGGFALMTEGVSLAGMTETPVVIVVAQRPGPATGLPTRTEQGDLEMILYAGHGEFPRAVFAPGDLEECFHLTRRAFGTAEKYQGPVFILTDQFLADSYRAVDPIDVTGLDGVEPGADPGGLELPYKRFAMTSNGISPRLLPGRSSHLVVADSDEHDEAGHITEDLSIRKRMVGKRLRKMKGLLREVIPPYYEGNDSPDLLLVCWGSAKGAVCEAAERLREEGRDAAVLHFSQLRPLDPGQFLGKLEGAQEVVSVEGNATGQFGRLLHRETGFEIKREILRYDGLPITPEYLLQVLKRV